MTRFGETYILVRPEGAPEYRLLARYHVPRSQVWPGSRGAQRGKVHLHVLNGPATFTAPNGRKLKRGGGVPLCGKRGQWYGRAPEGDEERCPRCVDFAGRYGVSWPWEASGVA